LEASRTKATSSKTSSKATTSYPSTPKWLRLCPSKPLVQWISKRINWLEASTEGISIGIASKLRPWILWSWELWAKAALKPWKSTRKQWVANYVGIHLWRLREAARVHWAPYHQRVRIWLISLSFISSDGLLLP